MRATVTNRARVTFRKDAHRRRRLVQPVVQRIVNTNADLRRNVLEFDGIAPCAPWYAEPRHRDESFPVENETSQN